MAPQLIFGTGTMGMDEVDFKDAASVSSLLQLLKSCGVARIDTAARYPGLFPGRAEELLGQCKDQASDFSIDTKIALDMKTDGSGELTPEAVDKSVSDSLSRLQCDSVNILHNHRPDPSTPIRDQVRAFNEQIQKGRCRTWGVSNLTVKMADEILRVCDEEGLQKPMAFQSQYNIITRGIEAELLPLLRRHGVAFNAYAPLAAGYMTGNFVNGTASGTRFDPKNAIGKVAQARYSEESLQDATKEFINEVKAHSLEPMEVAIRWLCYHSALGDQDGVVFGASKERQITQLMAYIKKGSLPADVLKSVEQLWDRVKDSRTGWF